MISKRIQLVIAGALLTPFGVRANDIDPAVEFQNVAKATTAIVIDGDLKEWKFTKPVIDPKFELPKGSGYGNGTGSVVHEPHDGGVWDDTSDQSNTTEFVWTNDGLYIGLVVTDDYHENAANSPWNGDSVQMMITTADRSTDHALYNFALGGTEDQLVDDPLPLGDYAIMHEKGFAESGTDQSMISDIAIVRDTKAKKTYYELFLPTETLGLEAMAVGAQFGFGMAINDGDEDFPGQKGWGGLGAHAIVFGKTPAETALLTLVAGGSVCNPNTKGDADGNGKIEFADFLVLSSNFGNSVTDHSKGDVDCNGKVEFADFLLLSANFGASVGGAGAAAAVPEPSSLIGFSSLLLGGFLSRRRRPS